MKYMTLKNHNEPDELVLVQTFEEAVVNERAEGKSVNSDPFPRMIARAAADGFTAFASRRMSGWRCYLVHVEPREAVGP